MAPSGRSAHREAAEGGAAAPSAGQRAAGRAQFAITGSLAVVTVLAHVAGATLWPGTLWGAHAYAFLPAQTLPAALPALAVVLGVGFAVLRRAPPAVTLAAGPHARHAWRTEGVIAAAAFALFWIARSRQILLGDGIPLTANLPYETALHAREPLTSLIQQQAYRAVHAASAGRDVHEVARDAVALGSVLAGVAFVLIALRLADELLRLRAGPLERGPDPGLRLAVAAVLCVQGSVQLFFGYVENYAWQAAAIAAYLWLALRFLRGAAPLAAPLVALLVAVALNLAAFTLVASFVVLAGAGLLRTERRLAAVRDLGIGVVLAAALGFALQAADPGYRIDREFAAMLEKGAGDAAYLVSAAHLRDFASAQLLIGPYALFWFLPVLGFAVAVRLHIDPARLFLIVAALIQTAAFWTLADLPLGYARDWDLFAPFSTVFTASAFGLVFATLARRDVVQRVLLVAVAVSLFHTAPWIALNTSAGRSLERFKQLPLGKGRTESTVGFWYFSQGNHVEARVWLERALAADPSNVRAHGHLGNLHLAAGRYEEAGRHFETAVRMRPNQPMFRERLVRARIAEHRTEEALAHLAVLVEQEPGRARHWAMAAVLLYGGGRPIEAHEAMQRAIELAPGDSVYVAAFARMAAPPADVAGHYAALIEHEWPLILGR